MKESLKYIYNRLTPFKLDTTDKTGVCPDYQYVTPAVVEDAGFDDLKLYSLPRDVFHGKDSICNGDGSHNHDAYIFSKKSLASYIDNTPETNVSEADLLHNITNELRRSNDKRQR